jgi:crotonobetainyl-CoA:carnitine CoA-transferase CaiB-like acyl-CoA transferase
MMREHDREVQMTGALEGTRVIDFGQYIAGPLAAQLLADQAADVIRVDPPGGPRWDTPANATWNRGKRSIVLDLKTSKDLVTARRLIETADVVVENFRPGVMDRLGLGAEASMEANPRLIYCSLPGFAADDPRAEVPAWEGVVGAATATYRHARVGAAPGTPVYTALPLASSYAAIQTAVSVAMALKVRDRDGLGQRIEVPLFDAMFGAVGYNGLRIHGDTSAPLRGGGISGQFECSDGRWVMFMTGNSRNETVLKAAGVESWIAEGFLDRERLSADPDLAKRAQQSARDLFKTRTATEWEQLVADAGGECAICRPSAEWLEHEHALSSKTIVEVIDHRYGKMRQPGLPARMSLTPGAVQGPAPKLNADRDAILAELDALAPVPSAPARNGATTLAALDGLRVLDLCIVLAGPTCGRTLAEYGADVIKIEAPDRPPSTNFHPDINRGKRSIVLDLKREDGIEIFWRLVEDADVIAQNFRKGIAEKLGIGYEQVRDRKPDIIYASLNTYGHVGTFDGRPGHEQIAQAATGMQLRYGGDEQPQLQRYAVNDYGTGYMGAFGVALAALHRERTGQGQHIDAALAFTATTLQSQFMQSFEGKVWDEPRGQSSLGSGPLHRAYEASDGWLFLGGSQSDLDALATLDGLKSVATLDDDALEAVLTKRVARGTVSEGVERFTQIGFGAHRVLNDTRDLMDDPWVINHGLSVTREHGGVGTVTTTGPAPRLSRSPVGPGRAAPALGSDAGSILADVDMEADLERLTESRVVIV